MNSNREVIKCFLSQALPKAPDTTQVIKRNIKASELCYILCREKKKILSREGGKDLNFISTITKANTSAWRVFQSREEMYDVTWLVLGQYLTLQGT